MAFDYWHHGEDWVQGKCGSRDRQSPIDIEDQDLGASPDATKESLYYSYPNITESFMIRNNGHVLLADFVNRGFGGVTYNNAWYNLERMEVHARSEHTLKGQPENLEIQLVHKKADSYCGGNAYVIVAILMRASNVPLPSAAPIVGAAAGLQPPAPAPAPMTTTYVPPDIHDQNFHPALYPLLETEPPQVGAHRKEVLREKNEFVPLRLSSLVGGGTYARYKGSLSAPPCSETATWYVRREPVMASDAQVRILQDLLYQTTHGSGNFRALMLRGTRPVDIVSAVEGEPALTVETPDEIPIVPDHRTGREINTENWARNAIKTAFHALGYAKDLDARIHAAADAHMQASLPDPRMLAPTTTHVPYYPTTRAPGFTDELTAEIKKDTAEMVSQAMGRIGTETRNSAIKAVWSMLHPAPGLAPAPAAVGAER